MKTDENWEQLTPEEKRDLRIKSHFNLDDIQFKNQNARKCFKERMTRLLKVYRCQEPDRVPVSLPAGNFPAFYSGTNLKTVMYDYKVMRASWNKFLHDFKNDMDMIRGPGAVHPARVLEILDIKTYNWPGHGLDEHTGMYQYVENEYMSSEEYDVLLEDPSDFAMRRILPRMAGSLTPFKDFSSYTGIISHITKFAAPFTRPEVQKMFQAFIDAGKEMARWQKEVRHFNREALAEGFPSIGSTMAFAPFDVIGDSLRGTRGVLLDMFRQPEKLLDAIELLTKKLIRETIETVNKNGGLMVRFPLHKGDDTFMSEAQFEKFYWPGLKKFVDELIQEGIMVTLFAEGKYQNRLHLVDDFPKGWVHWMFDQTDMSMAKQTVGKTCSISGNVPAALMCTGTAREVKDYCRNLIETCAPGGGYLLTGGASATETNPENLRAMMEAALEYGIYK